MSLELFGEIGNFHPRSSRTNLQLDKKFIADLVPFSHGFSMRKNYKKSCQFSLQTKKRRYWEDIVAIHKYNKKSSHPTSLWAAYTIQV
jgi:hypothetical protein